MNRRKFLSATAATAAMIPLHKLVGKTITNNDYSKSNHIGMSRKSDNKPTLHVYNDYGWLRGFSIVPSWGARIEEAWWFYNPEKMRKEVSLATKVHANCIRLWIEYTAWMADPVKIKNHFLDAIAAIDEAGMKTMPCLFNRWHGRTYDYGGLYNENIYHYHTKPETYSEMETYIKDLVSPLAEDERVLIWDLCNEPQAYTRSDDNSDESKRELAFFEKVAKSVRETGVKQPITIGTMNHTQIEHFAHICDVLCAHPYKKTPEDLEAYIKDLKILQGKINKPLLVNETMPGSLSDQTRAEVVKYYSQMLAEAKFGWMGWALREGKAISTRRDRIDPNGINFEGYHPFFTKEGKLRDGLDFLTQIPQQLPPWKNK